MGWHGKVFNLGPDRVQVRVLEKKIIAHIANALQSDIGTESYANFIGFYEEFEKKYYSYFHDNSIYTYWIGSISESHKLLDT